MPNSISPDWLNKRPRWQQALMMLGLGLALVGALPPLYIWPLAALGRGGFFVALDHSQSVKAGFWRGWLFGAGFFGGGLYWLTNAFLVHSTAHAWMIPIALPLLALGIGLFQGLMGALTVYVFSKVGRGTGLGAVVARLLVFASLWAVVEWLRSWIFTGFPWNLAGTIWGFSDALLQGAAAFGAYGFSLVTVAICSLFVLVVYPFASVQRMIVGIVALALIGLLWGGGALRLAGAETAVHDDVILRLVQGNIAQKDKWDRALQYQNFQDQLLLSVQAPEDGKPAPTHILWPETAATYSLSREPNAVQALAQVAPKGGMVITGTPRMTPRTQPYQVWNSLMAVRDTGEIAGYYDKAHLVPFGEYIPLRDWNPFPKLTAGQVDFSAGAGLETMTLDGLPPFSPLICYEIIFPHSVTAADQVRPQWLLNLTNDGWYGHSAGPYQHLMASRMRSIEEGLPLVRVAGTGISVVTDAYGQVTARLDYGVRGVVDAPLPVALSAAPLGGRYPLAILWGMVLASFVLAWKQRKST